MHDPTKVLLGSTASSDKHGISPFSSDPGVYKAGLAVRLASTGLLSIVKSDGRWIGVSLGRDLSDCKKTSVLSAGSMVPVLIEQAPARGVVTVTSYANLVSGTEDTLKVGATTFTFKASPSTESQIGAVTSNNATAANIVTKVNAHSVAGTLFVAQAVGAVVTITAKNNATLGSAIDLVYTDNDSNIGATVDDVTFTGGNVAADYIVKGAHVYFSDTTGKADDPESGASVSNAVYMSGVLSGIDEDGNAAACAYVDMGGGL